MVLQHDGLGADHANALGPNRHPLARQDGATKRHLFGDGPKQHRVETRGDHSPARRLITPIDVRGVVGVRERVGPGLPHVEHKLVLCAGLRFKLGHLHGWLDIGFGKRGRELDRALLGFEGVAVDMNPLLRSSGDSLPAGSNAQLPGAERSATKPGNPCLGGEHGAIGCFGVVHDRHLVDDEGDVLGAEAQWRPARVDRGKRRRILAQAPDVSRPGNLERRECVPRQGQGELPNRVCHRVEIAASGGCATAPLSPRRVGVLDGTTRSKIQRRAARHRDRKPPSPTGDDTR